MLIVAHHESIWAKAIYNVVQEANKPVFFMSPSDIMQAVWQVDHCSGQNLNIQGLLPNISSSQTCHTVLLLTDDWHWQSKQFEPHDQIYFTSAWLSFLTLWPLANINMPNKLDLQGQQYQWRTMHHLALNLGLNTQVCTNDMFEMPSAINYSKCWYKWVRTCVQSSQCHTYFHKIKNISYENGYWLYIHYLRGQQQYFVSKIEGDVVRQCQIDFSVVQAGAIILKSLNAGMGMVLFYQGEKLCFMAASRQLNWDFCWQNPYDAALCWYQFEQAAVEFSTQFKLHPLKRKASKNLLIPNTKRPKLEGRLVCVS